MSAVAASPARAGFSSFLRTLNTILCCGLNLAVSRVRQSRYARLVIALIVLNEIRGIYVVYTAANHALLPWIS